MLFTFETSFSRKSFVIHRCSSCWRRIEGTDEGKHRNPQSRHDPSKSCGGSFASIYPEPQFSVAPAASGRSSTAPGISRRQGLTLEFQNMHVRDTRLRGGPEGFYKELALNAARVERGLRERELETPSLSFSSSDEAMSSRDFKSLPRSCQSKDGKDSKGSKGSKDSRPTSKDSWGDHAPKSADSSGQESILSRDYHSCDSVVSIISDNEHRRRLQTSYHQDCPRPTTEGAQAPPEDFFATLQSDRSQGLVHVADTHGWRATEAVARRGAFTPNT